MHTVCVPEPPLAECTTAWGEIYIYIYICAHLQCYPYHVHPDILSSIDTVIFSSSAGAHRARVVVTAARVESVIDSSVCNSPRSQKRGCIAQ